MTGEDDTDVDQREAQPDPRRSWWVTAALAVVVAPLILLIGDLPAPLIPWWLAIPLFGLGYAAAETWTLPVRHGSETQAYSLAELPLTLGLLLASPVALIAGRAIGQIAALYVHRRQSLEKLCFNLLLGAVEIATAYVVLTALVSPEAVLTRSGAYALLVAVLAVDFVGNLWLTAVVSAVEGRPRLDLYRPTVLLGAPPAIASAALAFITVLVVQIDPWLLGPLVVVVALLVLAFRAHTTLEEQHTGLERIAGFTSTIGIDQATMAHVRELLNEAQSVLDAELVELTVEGATSWYHLAGEMPDSVPADTLLQSLPREVAQPTLFPAGRAASRRTELQRVTGLRDAIVVPLPAGGTSTGTLVVANRRGELTTFGPNELGIAESVANHLAVAHANARLASELRAQAQESEHRARHDHLTGLPNRSALLEHCRALPADARFCLMLLDLDRFKEVNDALGHATGDDLLRQVAVRLRQTVGTGPLITRLGGDEFALVVDGELDHGMEVGQRIVAALSRPFTLSGVEVEIGASVGISHAPTHGSTTGDLLQRADIAMYKAKQGEDGVELYRLDDDQASMRHLQLSTDLRGAIADGQIRLQFQPLVNLRTRAVEGFEALARWEHPVHGVVPPGEFVAMAERAGLIRELTVHVAQEAAAACQRWREAGIDAGVSVNLSARSLVDQSIPHTLQQIVREAGVPTRCLTIEVTESSLMTDPERAAPIIQEITDSGMRVAIDDFGTGYSSLAYLGRLDIDVVKIDRSFVLDRQTARGAAIIRSIIDLGHHLDMSVTAEGIETTEDLGWLIASGCDTGQGYHISRPLDEDALPTFVASWTGADRTGLAASRAARAQAV